MRFTHQFSRAAFVLFAVFLCGFLLSFVIEYRQVWLVTRQSSLRDLYLNSVGAVCGAVMSLLWLYVSRHIKRGEVKN